MLVRDPGAPGAVRVKILDFGIAKLGATRFGTKQQTQGGTVLGTPAYMAPEQCRGFSEVDARADLYAFGCILFELLAGRPPFLAETGVAVVRMHLEEPPPRVGQLAPHVPAELDALIAKLLVKDPGGRTPSAAYALAALERISLPPLGGDIAILAGAARAVSLPEQRTAYLEHPLGAPPSKRFPIVVLVIAIAIAAAAIVGIGLYA
jgi:serine/threonine protein kinase